MGGFLRVATGFPQNLLTLSVSDAVNPKTAIFGYFLR
jgi:hypothetical protein